jgi:hypothetical protein
MRRLSAALVAITAAIALTALSASAWAKPEPKSTAKPLVVSPSEVRPGQLVKVSGSGCRGITVLVFLIDGQEFHRGATRSGDFTYQVKLPSGLRSGSHDLSAKCRGGNHKPARFHVSRRASFDVSPDTVTAGDKVHADGNGCRRRSHVSIKLDGKEIAHFLADKHGTFDRRVRIPKGTRKGRHLVSAVCGGRHIGSDGIWVKRRYEQDRNQLSTDRSVVEVGQKLKVTGDNCPDGLPVASLDGAPVALSVASKGKGFTAEATVPSGTAPGKHKLYAGCDAGSSGTTELNVLDPDSTETAAARQAFSPQPPSDLAMWAGLFAGIALLVASVAITTRRRSNRG